MSNFLLRQSYSLHNNVLLREYKEEKQDNDFSVYGNKYIPVPTKSEWRTSKLGNRYEVITPE